MAKLQSPKTRKSGCTRKKELSLQEKLSDATLTYYSHYCIPGLNLNKAPWVERWDLESIMNLYKNYPYTSDLPKPLLPPSKNTHCLLTNRDPALDIIFTKNIIQDDIDKILHNFEKHSTDHQFVAKKDVQWTANDDKQETTLPRYLADLSDIIEMDPDPFFEGRYNWYYTGGSMTGFTLNGQFILLFPYMNELVAMPLCLKDGLTWKPIFKNAAKCTVENTIYELRYKPSPFCRVLARLKDECIFFSFKEDEGKLQLIVLDNKPSTVPFVSADLPQFDSNQYCTLNVNQSIEINDMLSGKLISKADLTSNDKLQDTWGSLRYQLSNPDVLTYTNRNCIHYFDVRALNNMPVLTMCPTPNLENCESISLQLYSNRPSRLYIGTYHSFLMCDDRVPNDCVYQKWTHQLKSTPLQGSVSMNGDEEMIVISSQICTDKSIIINNWNDCDNSHSYYPPYTPPSILDTLRECQRLGKCLDPLLTSRLQLSTTGIHMNINENDNSFIFYQNSIGDIFYQCITHEKNSERMPFFNSHAQYALDCWERQILTHEDPLTPFVLSDQVNMEDTFNAFLNVELKYSVEPEKESYLPKYWKQSIEKLNSYVDLLAPELLAVWEITDDGEPGSSSNQHQKVLNWLEMADEKVEIEASQAVSDAGHEQDYLFTPIESQELMSVSQQYVQQNDSIEIHDDFAMEPINRSIKREISNEISNDFQPEELYLPPVRVKSKSKKVKAKSGFTDGF